MKSDTSQTNHFSDLDGMRGILACLVMLMHYGMDRIISKASHGFIQRCEWDLSVDFFFVLSGFVLARSFQKRPPTLEQYAVKRVFRLAPMFMLTLFIAMACGLTEDLWTTLANLLIVPSIIGLHTINFPAWSIPFELYFPAVGLLFAGRSHPWNEPVAKIAFVLALAAASACAYGLAVQADYRILRAAASLSLGLLLYVVGGQKVSRLPSSAPLVIALFVSVLIVMALARRLPPLALLFPILVVAVILFGAATRSIFSGAPCQALGRWSYSIYLLHMPVLWAVDAVYGVSATNHNPLLKLSLAAVTIALAALCYRFIELPMIEVGNKWVRRDRPSPVSESEATA